jgi:hypothetical protein
MFSYLAATRRDFLKTSAAVAVTTPAVASLASVAEAMLPHATMSMPATTIDRDMLRAVGERIGFDAALRVAPNGEPVSLMYFDYAGTTVDALRVGIERGLALQSGGEVAAVELSLPYGELLGVAVVRNLNTAVETRIEIDPTMLSHLALIEANAPSAGIAKTAVMSADASYFYRTAEFA